MWRLSSCSGWFEALSAPGKGYQKLVIFSAFVIRLFKPSNQTTRVFKHLQICKTHVFHLCHQRIGGFPWVWWKSIEDQVVLFVGLEVIPGCFSWGKVQNGMTDASGNDRDYQRHTIADIFSETRSIIAHLHSSSLLSKIKIVIIRQWKRISWHFLGDMVDPCSKLQQLFLGVRRAAALAFEEIIVKDQQNLL